MGILVGIPKVVQEVSPKLVVPKGRPPSPTPTVQYVPTDESPHLSGATVQGGATSNEPRQKIEIWQQGGNPYLP